MTPTEPNRDAMLQRARGLTFQPLEGIKSLECNSPLWGAFEEVSRKVAKHGNRDYRLGLHRHGADLGPVHLLRSHEHPCAPRVLVERLATGVTVKIVNRPWGWPDTSKTFLNPFSPKAICFADELAERLRNAAIKEANRKGVRYDGPR